MTCQLSSIQKKILNLLMDKYENSLTYKGGNKVNQSFAIRPAEVYPEYTSNYASVDEVHSFEIQVRLLEEKDLITSTKKYNAYTKIFLNQEKCREIYSLLDRKEKDSILSSQRSFYVSRLGRNEIADALCREQIARIDEGKKPAYSLADAGILVRLLDVIVHNQEDMLERELSITVFADSKTFEKSWRSRVCRILQKYGDKDADLSNKAEREIEIALLERYHIYANPSYVFMEGNGSILFQNGKTMELTAGIPLALPQRSLQKIRKISISDHALMTIENLTSFNRTEKEDTFLIYLSGYSSSLKKKLLQKIHQDNPSLRWFHFGDIDPDGFLILEDLREQTWIPFDPYCMGIEELVEYSSYCRSLNENDRKKAADLIERNLYCEVMQYMLDHNCKLEQEIISWNQSRKNK